MKTFLRKLLGLGKAPAMQRGATEAFAPGTQIAYDARLIDRFKGHHQSLLKIFEAIMDAGQARRYDELTIRIRSFKRVLSEHLLEENVRLYTYLTYCLTADHDSLEMVREMHLEMSAIGRKVNAFIRHYDEFGVNDLNVAKFQEELTDIGSALVDRIQREERSLYSLYLPPQSYSKDRVGRAMLAELG